MCAGEGVLKPATILCNSAKDIHIHMCVKFQIIKSNYLPVILFKTSFSCVKVFNNGSFS